MYAKKGCFLVVLLFGLGLGVTQLVGQSGVRTVSSVLQERCFYPQSDKEYVVKIGAEEFICSQVVCRAKEIDVWFVSLGEGDAAGFITTEPCRITIRKKKPADTWPSKGEDRLDGWDGSYASMGYSPNGTVIKGVRYTEIIKYERKDGWSVIVDKYWLEDSKEVQDYPSIDKDGKIIITPAIRKPIIRNANGTIREEKKAEEEPKEKTSWYGREPNQITRLEGRYNESK